MKFAYNKLYWDKYHEKVSVKINPLKNPSLLLTGSSGAGKSYSLKWLLLNLLVEQKVNLWFCNYKDSCDFKFLKLHEKYYTGEACEEGFQKFYEYFLEMQKKIRRQYYTNVDPYL